MLGKDHHIHIRIYACATLYWKCQWAEGLKRLLWRDGEGWQERVSVRLVEGEGFCCSLYKQPLMNKILNGSLLISDDFSKSVKSKKLSQRYNETRNAEQSDDTQGTHRWT